MRHAARDIIATEPSQNPSHTLWPQCEGPIHWCSCLVVHGHQWIAKCGLWSNRPFGQGCELRGLRFVNSAPPRLLCFFLGELRRGSPCYSLFCGSWRASPMFIFQWTSGLHCIVIRHRLPLFWLPCCLHLVPIHILTVLASRIKPYCCKSSKASLPKECAESRTDWRSFRILMYLT